MAERYLRSDKESSLLQNVIIPRVRHIHARIGTCQAPQVADPEDPHVHEAVERCMGLWGDVWRNGRPDVHGDTCLRFVTPEFGPTPYTPMVKGEAVSNVRTICDAMVQRLHDAFQSIWLTKK